MFIRNKESPSQIVRRHRNVYRFGGTWAQTLLTAVPWVNAVILVLLILSVHDKITVSPGILFDLPTEPLREGTHSSMTAMMIPVASEVHPGRQETMIFFDDDRYMSSDPEQMGLLSERLRQISMQNRPDGSLLLLADKRVPNGDILGFVNRAREAGITLVNIALKPE